MEYVYAAMLLHKVGKAVDEASVKKVLQAAGATVEDARVKALVAALHGVNIDEAIQKASITPVVAAPAAGEGKKAEAKKEEKTEEKAKEESEAAAAGLGALFG